MTGYGQGAAELSHLRVTIELRTVNNRFADLRFRLPQELAAEEGAIRRKIQRRVRRGRVELTVNLEQQGEAATRPTLNRSLLEELVAGAETLSGEFKIKGELDLSAVVGVPGLFRVETPEVVWGDGERNAVGQALDQALDALDGDRCREGTVLQRELVGRIDTMTRLLQKIRQRAAAVPSALRDRLEQRLAVLRRDGAELDPARVAQEAVFLADRSDVTEEIVRLEGHLEQAHSLLAEPDDQPVGKRLEFLLQEINRETNTINSKPADLELTREALTLKAEAEKVREQIQNLE